MDKLRAVRERFAEMVEGPADDVDLVNAVLLIARTAYPEIVSAHYTVRLDNWAARLHRRMDGSESVGGMLSVLNRILFEEEGLRGDKENYYDTQNSFLNRVMDRKLGIPITLALIYSEVGRRAGFPVNGYALPGHFMAGMMHTTGVLYVDVFNGGEILAEEECRKKLAALYGDRIPVDDTVWKIPASKKSILARMLRNLKGIYHNRGDELNCLEMIQWILSVEPDSPAELKDRGVLYASMGNDANALHDLERYLEVAPESDKTESVAAKVRQLRKTRRWIH